jgi:hypothetical protein
MAQGAPPSRRHPRVWGVSGGVLRILVIAGITAFLSLTLLNPPVAQAAPTPSSSGVQLSVTGVGPGAVSLGWSVSATLLLTFDHYLVLESQNGSNGPWTTLATVRDATATSFYWDGLSPGLSYGWEVAVYTTVGSEATSNAVIQTQPAVASLTGSAAGSDAANLSWTNSASYGGGVAFSSYTIELSTNNGSFVAGSPIPTESRRSVALSGLTAGSWYRAYVITADACSGAANCASFATTSTSDSNLVAFSTPPPLRGWITSAPASLTVGAPGTFSCSASGGAPPLKTAWRFGDGTGAPSGSAQHSYASAGIYEAICIVRDALGSRTEAFANVSVSPPGGGSNGNSSGNTTGGSNGSSTGNSTGPTTNGTGSKHSGSGGGGGVLVGPPPSTSSPMGTALGVFLVIAFIGAILGLAVLVGRRRTGFGSTPSRQLSGPGPGPGAGRPVPIVPPPGAAGQPLAPPPGGAVVNDPSPSLTRRPARGVPAHRPAGGSAGSGGPVRPDPPQDLDQLLDELEGE